MGRVAVITGASRGIGAATALVLAERGFRVVVNYRSSAEEADEVVRAVSAAGGEAVAIRADVTAPDDVAAMIDETNEKWGRVDVLVQQRIDSLRCHLVRRSELGAARRQAGPRAACRLPGYESGCARDGFPQLRPAGLSHHGVVPPAPRRHDHGGHRQGGDGPVCPLRCSRAGAARDHRQPRFARHVGRYRGDTAANALLEASEVRQLGATNPMGRLVRPEEIAKTVAFLASEDSAFTTGHCLEVNGGLAMD
jgi:hypothetical protein